MSLHDQYRIFYHCDETGGHVPSDQAVAYELDTIIDMSMQILREDGDFLGIIDAADACVQFMSLGGGKIEIDIPDRQRKGSFKKQIHENEIEFVVRNVASLFSSTRTGFVFEAW
jgi:hypothetical protein